jgi:hypothetical protein
MKKKLRMEEDKILNNLYNSVTDHKYSIDDLNIKRSVVKKARANDKLNNKIKESIKDIAIEEDTIEYIKKVMNDANKLCLKCLKIIEKYVDGDKVDKYKVSIALKFFGIENFYKIPRLYMLIKTIEEERKKECLFMEIII